LGDVFHDKSYECFFDKNGLGHILSDFSQTHPVALYVPKAELTCQAHGFTVKPFETQKTGYFFHALSYVYEFFFCLKHFAISPGGCVA
jgi:hypothetical protein